MVVGMTPNCLSTCGLAQVSSRTCSDWKVTLMASSWHWLNAHGYSGISPPYFVLPWPRNLCQGNWQFCLRYMCSLHSQPTHPQFWSLLLLALAYFLARSTRPNHIETQWAYWQWLMSPCPDRTNSNALRPSLVWWDIPTWNFFSPGKSNHSGLWNFHRLRI